MKKTLLSFVAMLLLTACSALPGAATPIVFPTSSPVPTPTPVPWATLGLTGQLVFTRGNTGGVEKLDLASGGVTSLFKPPENNWGVNEAAVSPDNQRILLSYAPPLSPADMQFGYTSLYELPVDGSAPPQLLIKLTDPYEIYNTPTWSPDGRYFYYVHSTPVYDANKQPIATQYRLERRAYPGGSPEVILENALWPRLSPDGSKLVYVPAFPGEDPNQLYMANVDGTNIVPLIPDGTFDSVDTPLFSPDGQMVYFTAVGAQPGPTLTPAQSALDRFFGSRIAFAHPNAADWWAVSVAGGAPHVITEYNFATANMEGDFSPDGRRFAFATFTNLHIINPDGSNLLNVFDFEAVGTVDWIF
jgi:dipeptidyl aminopeptidase/acylaminoacyl peptidase